MIGTFEYRRAGDVASAVALVSADPERAVSRRRNDTGRPAQRRRADPRAAGRHHPPAAPRDHQTRRHSPGRGADHDGGVGGRASARRAGGVRARGAAGGRLDPVAQHGDDRREPPAAHALPLLPRSDGARLQQASARIGVCSHHRSGADARDPRRQRTLHRVARLGPLRSTGRARYCRARPGHGRPAHHPAHPVLPRAGRSTRRRERPRSRRADHCDRDPASSPPAHAPST